MAAKKVVNCSFSEIDATIKEMASFGWDHVTTDFNKDLEHQYIQVQKTTYIGTIVWALLGGLLILFYFLLTSFQFRVVFLMLGIPFLGVAVILFLNRTILMINKRKYCRLIIREADINSGNVREAPLLQNIANSEEHSGLIRKNIKQINKK